MLSRGKILVKLAQQTIKASAEHQHFTIQSSTITQENSINSEAISLSQNPDNADTNSNRENEVDDGDSLSEIAKAVRQSDEVVDNAYSFIAGTHEDTGLCTAFSDEEVTDDADPDYVQPNDSETSDTDVSDVANPGIVNEQHEVDHEEEVETELPISGKRKKANQRSEHKKLRMQGKRYLGIGKNEDGNMTLCVDREGRMLSPRTCTSRCQKGWGGRKCSNIVEETRAEIFKTFWDTMTWGEKKVYIIGLVEKKETKRKTTGEGETSRRKYSYDFFLRYNNTKVKVCQSLFLSTFGLRNETVYRWVDERYEEHGIPKSPTAGQVRMGNRKDAAKDAAEQYLSDIPKLPSHYCRSQSSKLYIETSHTTLRELFIDYKSLMEQSGKPVYGISQFTRMFNEKNLAFFKPKKDLCDTCCSFKAGTIQEEVYRQHIQRKEEAAAKALDKELAEADGKQKVITMDLQSLLLCPKIQASCLYYKTKLCCHNFTLFDLTSRDALCYFWNETGADLNASTFVTCIVDYLEKLDTGGLERIVLYSDGCTYQNRNTTLANALLQFSVKHGIIIEQKFLERGHTYMECDSIHATIQRYIKNRDIFVPQQYVDAIQRSRKKPYEVKYVDHSFFKDYSKLLFYTSIRPGVGVGSPVVTDIRNLQYTPDGRILYKMNYSEEYTELRKPRTQSSKYTDEAQSAYSRPLKLKKNKFQHLQQIKTVLPNDYHAYYDNLPHE